MNIDVKQARFCNPVISSKGKVLTFVKADDPAYPRWKLDLVDGNLVITEDNGAKLLVFPSNISCLLIDTSEEDQTGKAKSRAKSSVHA